MIPVRTDSAVFFPGNGGKRLHLLLQSSPGQVGKLIPRTATLVEHLPTQQKKKKDYSTNSDTLVVPSVFCLQGWQMVV